MREGTTGAKNEAGAQLLHFPFRKTLRISERKKIRFSLSSLQFGKELLEVKSKAEQKRFSRDICSPAHEKTPEIPAAFQHTECALYLNGPIHPQK